DVVEGEHDRVVVALGDVHHLPLHERVGEAAVVDGLDRAVPGVLVAAIAVRDRHRSVCEDGAPDAAVGPRRAGGAVADGPAPHRGGLRDLARAVLLAAGLGPAGVDGARGCVVAGGSHPVGLVRGVRVDRHALLPLLLGCTLGGLLGRLRCTLGGLLGELAESVPAAEPACHHVSCLNSDTGCADLAYPDGVSAWRWPPVPAPPPAGHVPGPPRCAADVPARVFPLAALLSALALPPEPSDPERHDEVLAEQFRVDVGPPGEQLGPQRLHRPPAVVGGVGETDLALDERAGHRPDTEGEVPLVGTGLVLDDAEPEGAGQFPEPVVACETPLLAVAFDDELGEPEAAHAPDDLEDVLVAGQT